MNDDDTTRGVTFVGLGNLGEAMARHLADTGWTLRVHDRSADKVRALVSAGATAAGDSLADGVDYVCLAVPDDEAVLGLVEGGLLDQMRSGQTLVVHSTILPGTARDLGRRFSEKGIGFVDAPVSGGSERARTGDLVVFAGAGEAELAQARPLLDTVARRVIHLGPAGAGAATKLANQLVMFAALGAIHEALDLTRAFEVADDTVLTALDDATGDTWVGRNWGFFDRTAAAYDEGGTPVGERPWSKDLREVVAAAGETGIRMPLAGLLAEHLADVVENSARIQRGNGEAA